MSPRSPGHARLVAALTAIATLALFAVATAPAHVQPDMKLALADSTSASGGFVNVGMNGGHVLRIVPSLKGLEAGTTYDVWLVSCSGPPGGHPCGIGPLDGVGVIGSKGSAPGCVGNSPGTAGPAATETANPSGNANPGAILVDLSGVAPGTYYFHVDVGPAAHCHPGGSSPPGMFFTDGFSLTI